MSGIPKSFIKSVALEIHHAYRLDNTPFPIDEENGERDKTDEAFFNKTPKEKKNIPFIGRTQHIAKFLSFLKNSSGKGVFMVTGYRGMGKTSFVNHVIHRYKIEQSESHQNKEINYSKYDKIRNIHLTLTQNNPKEVDILRLMVSSVFDSYKVYSDKYNKYINFVNKALAYWQLFLITVLLYSMPLVGGNFLHLKFSWANLMGWEFYEYSLGSVLTIYVLVYTLLKILKSRIGSSDGAYNRIHRLMERCYNTLSEERAATDEYTVPLINFKFFGGSEKRTKQYPFATTKEIEHELQKFLEKAKKEDELEFIFIFDELDKVDPLINTSFLSDEFESSEKLKLENAYERNLRERKQAIISIIAGLKNFFTSADARFIFIAGNEMFDASLADISDRQSQISSIFTYVFNIESLLKEKDLLENSGTINNSSLSNAIELYLKTLLFQCSDVEQKTIPLYEVAKDRYYYNSTEKEDSFHKVYFILQNFITYLTYRSNGSPKKLIKEIHEFIKVGKEAEQFDDKQTIIGYQKANEGMAEKLYLYFNYYNQYRIGFINYLYRPFLIKYGRSFKLYSDNLIVSTPYLFDHLIKFHPFAFSLSNLELVPEMLSPNKTPLLRQHIKKIIEYLGANHIREIEIGLFDYKFYSRTLNEITYLSKISEQEAAALNYTLDESYLVKLHVRNKIKELRSLYSKFSDVKEPYNQAFSIAHLNGVLGDLYFFDQQYDDAIVAYSDAIRPLSQLVTSKMNMQDFITLIRNRLKIGLCFEKINSYEDALAHYSNSSMDVTRFMIYRFGKEEHIDLKKRDKKSSKTGEEDQFESDKAIYQSASLSDLLQIILQSFLAQIFIQEKKSVAGISEIKLFIAAGSFLKITEGFLLHNTRNHIIKASAYLHTGNLLYFKNTDRQIVFKQEHQDVLPEQIYENLKLLKETYDNPLNKDQYNPILGLYFYVLGALETFAYRDDKQRLKNLALKKGVEWICAKKNIAFNFLTYLQEDESEENYRGIYYNYMGAFLSNIGDCLLSRYIAPINPAKPDEETYNKFDIQFIFKLDNWINPEDTRFNPKKREILFSDYLQPMSEDYFSLSDVLRCYYLAGKFYYMQGRASSSIFQYSKILYLLRLILTTEKNAPTRDKFVKMLEYTLVKPILRLVGQVAENTDHHMLKKAQELEINDHFSLNNLSNQPETREVVLLFNYIKIRIGEKLNDHEDHLRRLISPYNSFSTQHSRLLELAFYARYLELKVLKDLNNYGILTNEQKKTVESDGTDYLYSRLSILQILDIYGSDYWLGHSYVAYTHFRVGKYLKELNKHPHILKEIRDSLKKYLGKGSYASLNNTYHFAKAKKHYENTVQLHTAGDAYRSMVDDMIYLEDDFNDSAYHFGAALDRFMMTNKVFKNRIDDCNQEIEKNKDFNPENYLNI